MAKVAFGSIVSNARGKIGGIVFGKPHSGPNIRIRVRPTNPRSDGQSAIRADLTAASRAFKALSADDLALWRDYASGITKHQSVSGTAYHPTPIDAFTALAVKFLQIAPAGTIPSTPPTTPYVPDTPGITCAGGSGKVTFTAANDQAAGSKSELLLQPLKSANRTPSPKGYRTQMFWTADNATPVDVDHLAADYLHPSSALPAGTYVPAYRAVKTATGEQGSLIVLPAVTVT